MAHVEDCSVAYWVGRMGRVVLLGVHPTETSVLCLPLERKFGREVQENCSHRVWTRWPNSSLPSHPSLCIEEGLRRTRHGASFICTRRCLHFRPSSGAVERGCKGAECSLITNHMLWILNGRVQSPGGWWCWEVLSFVSCGMAWPSDESHYSSASAVFMVSEKIISR